MFLEMELSKHTGNLEQRIQSKANELGYESCGIVSLEKLNEYGLKIQERIQRVPQSEGFYQRQSRLIDPQQVFPWAQSVVIVTEPSGKYKVPEELKGHIGKHYLFDTRINQNTNEFQNGMKMEEFLQTSGLRFANERKFGLVGLRWAAMKAGLGIIRRNNFFYSKAGSYVTLQGWLIDRKLELIGDTQLPQCSDQCNRCIKACPSGSLSAPYTMSPNKCVSFLTTFGGRDLPKEPLSKMFGQCIYGCDICQDVCPMNKGKLAEAEDFPGVAELAPHLTPESILGMDDNYYRQHIQPKFFYLSPDDLWKWKINALNYMSNNYQDSYKPYILAACEHDHEKVREVAQWLRAEI
jgi:epoxyqueuosine reductase